ncbi:AMP-binding protein [Streptomyces sp. NPDC046805]|uniref:AMP-binding protein n=1 Tax=Streptomyces sp. NPDC046805 TaxID=3155134 RepID=UPI00340D56A7
MYSLYEKFAAIATHRPDDIAVDLRDCRLTYHDMRLGAEKLAGAIRESLGQRPRRIGLFASRSPLTYLGYLAVLRLGATVVPMNPSFPIARNHAIAEAAGVDLVLSDETASCREDVLPGRHLGLTAQAVFALPERAVEPLDAAPDDTAYIMFTSGSTGRPKGVPVQHRNVLAYAAYVVERYGLGPGCRLSQNFDLTFDLSVFDLFAAWTSGATVVPPGLDDLMSPVDYVNDRGLTHWFSVPSVVSFAQRLKTLAPGSMPGLRWSLFCGEQLTMDQAIAWQRAAPSAALENLYGPTELTVSCSHHRLPADSVDPPATSNGTVPIGRLHPFLESIVVDESGKPATDGELCVRGVQRFPGYLDAADDANRFAVFDGVAMSSYDGTAPLTDDHWYRTGDRVRVENGTLVHIGRIDNQIKIRGYRVEPGEIENALRRHPAVRDAAVVAITPVDGATDLAAAYTGTAVSEAELVRTLRERLPQYMVPRHFSCMEDLPKNANGKTDRLALTARRWQKDG